MKIAWNAIVKNEAAIIERCLNSLLPHVDGAIVADTGSTDGTPDLIRQAFEAAGKPVEMHTVPFENFSQARNAALRLARASSIDYRYLLLADADMELVVDKTPWLNGHDGLSYDMEQRAGGLIYSNRRLVKREATGEYMGVTHEYIDIPSAGSVDGAWFRDNADGANRAGKLTRDVVLLERALASETNPGLIQRYHFYLANSYFELGQWQNAATYYKRRVELGGWDEECWYAQFRYAHCFGHMGDDAGFVWEMLAAYEMRPQRAEALHALAKFFRERGYANFRSLLFSEAGFHQQRPADQLFIDDHVYASGLKEEFAICAYYDPRRRSRGAKECNKLALAGSEQARSNLFWYLKPLSDDVPSFKPEQISFQPPAGYVACNPSVINKDGKPLILVRTVNYTINADGGYDIRDGDGACSNHNPIHTRNFLTDSQHAVELLLPKNLLEPKYPLVRGFEDSRLFEWNEMLRTISTVRELNSAGWCEQVLAPMTEHGYDLLWRQILPKERRHEKNWMPWVIGDDLRFVYRLGTLIDPRGRIVFESAPGFDVSRISGGSQVIQVDERTWLAVVHEASTVPGRSNRFYQHRFVTFWANGRVDRISAPFFFHDRQIEFCAGLAVFGKQLMVSYGVRDCEAWTATMDVDEVLKFIYGGAL